MRADIKRLDELFSIYVRTLGADRSGYNVCFTCKAIVHWKYLDCGHWQSRKHNATRWDEKNCKPQCKMCNQYNDGMGEAFEKELAKLYGRKCVDDIRIQSRQIFNTSQITIKEMIEKYTQLIKKNGQTI